MKWSVVVGFLVVCLARYNEGGALKCTPGSEDHSCTAEKEEKAPPIQISKEDQTVEAPEAVETEAECLPGSEWDSNCHYCRCSESGIAECLKLDTCDTGLFAEPIKCKPSTSFKRDCNTCMCLENGLGLCTLEFCQTSTIPKKSEVKSGKECLPGSTWKSQCNQCRCVSDGYPLCTAIGCPDYESESPMRCAPSTVWKRECNTCWCTTEGRAMCTKMECINTESEPVEKLEEQDVQPNVSLSRKVRALPSPQEPPKICKPGQEFRMDCNKCLCDNEGQDFSCTRIDCIAQNNNNNGGPRSKREISHKVPSQCAPGSLFDRDCNVCRCTQDGQNAVCTLKRCQQKEKIDENHTTDTDQGSGFRCNAGEQFKQDCNDCTCSADGKSVFCTLRLCDEELTLSI